MAKAVPPTSPPAVPRARPREARRERMAQTFANIVSVLMRDPGFRNLPIAALEWLVLPAILSGQWKLAQSPADTTDNKTTGNVVVVPSAVALWASVSPEIDKRLSESLDKPLQLKSHEWLSGDILWLIAAAGDKRIVQRFLSELAATEFKGKKVKARITGPDGKVEVRMLRPQALKPE